MRVLDLAKGPYATLDAADTLADAAREMEDNMVSAVLVYSDDVLMGILTERDLVRAAADGARLDETPIEDYMTVSPVTVRASAGPPEALALMMESGFRHLPVLGEDGEIVGILKLRELVAALVPAGSDGG